MIRSSRAQASLIVGIIAAFLRRQGRLDLLRWVYVGVGTAVLLCIGVGVAWLVRPGSVQSALLTGMLGVQEHPVLIEVLGWFAYMAPIGVYVAWPPSRKVSARARLRVAAGSAGVGAAVALVLVLVTPGMPSANPVTGVGAASAQVVGPVGPAAVPIQTRLGRQDTLNEYIRHTGSALFAVPPSRRA
ncbi:MAG TPA: hypothetical protein VGX23_27475 [Actinocrinis sp.]|nr:hypothetical protein [Actinocrinis sp.]